MAKETRPATKAEREAFECGEQHEWECPDCGRVVAVLSALLVMCADCQRDRRVLVHMRRLQPEGNVDG